MFNFFGLNNDEDDDDNQNPVNNLIQNNDAIDPAQNNARDQFSDRDPDVIFPDPADGRFSDSFPNRNAAQQNMDPQNSRNAGDFQDPRNAMVPRNALNNSARNNRCLNRNQRERCCGNGRGRRNSGFFENIISNDNTEALLFLVVFMLLFTTFGRRGRR